MFLSWGVIVLIRQLTFSNFMSYNTAAIQLPAKGLVSITGANGAGKSSLVEGVSFGLFGKALRGHTPWRAGQAGYVKVETSQLEAEARVSEGGKGSLVWSRMDQPASSFDTMTKSREALAMELGQTWENWQRCSVFSSRGVSAFAEATDAERKRLLETLLGLDRFDTALHKARKVLTSIQNEQVASSTQLQVAKARRSEEEKLRRQLSAVPVTRVDPAMESQFTEWRQRELTYDKEWSFLREERTTLSGDIAAEEASIRGVQESLRRLGADQCPTCQQTVSQVVRFRLKEEADKKIMQFETEANILREKHREMLERMNQAGKTRDEARAKRTKLEAEVVAARRMKDACKDLDLKIHEATLQIARTEVEVEKLQIQVEALDLDVRHLDAVVQVLGVRGARSKILGSTLKGLSERASYWLGKLSGEQCRLELLEYTQKASGEEMPVLSMTIHGLGAGQYPSASSGERRRVDLALLFALSEISGYLHGAEHGTLWLDEVFDSLDPEGIAGVCECLAELSLHRPVVVISHDPRFIASLQSRCVSRFWINHGVISSVG